jgi:hypothetical protein
MIISNYITGEGGRGKNKNSRLEAAVTLIYWKLRNEPVEPIEPAPEIEPEV